MGPNMLYLDFFHIPCLYLVLLLLGRHASVLLGLWDKVTILYGYCHTHMDFVFFKFGYWFVRLNMAIFM
jgi:hypothetical protein